MQKKFFITTAIDYTNDVIHIGHSYQKILADCLARYHRLLGDKVYFLTGTDEHGQKVEKSAKEHGIDPKKFVDGIAEKDKNEWDTLDISYDRFIRTTDEDHKKVAQEFYTKSKENGDIYLDKYEGLYCEGCEAYYEEKDLIDGHCPFHPNKEIQKISEENYFFRLSKYQKFLEEHIASHPEFIQPESKRNEILSFIKHGLKDFSVSRQNVSWGIPIPGNPKHTIYVWFDALINYYTYGKEVGAWPADVHVLGKDNQRFHAIYWPAMLKSVDLPLPKTILVHDFFSLNGQKISKSLGNVILPSDLVKQFGVDAIRYFFLRYGPIVNDVNITIEKLRVAYNADLANGLGNLVARVAALCQKVDKPFSKEKPKRDKHIEHAMERFRPDEALTKIWEHVAHTDQYLSEAKPWEKEGEELFDILETAIEELKLISYYLSPFLPATAKKIQDQFNSANIKSGEPLFPRI
ncbi:methionine--tRNA ligase [Candidatus Woesebacteria bacterium RIFCSPHIGHO2_01_FULL_44_21]|uniref:Methionine--tRNA ligase n=1 Tax=Candidatus Woesebacteria bacterium RIFCSPHIGHO2_01_FULL_44_21 TaxID=1802503 RepID=A0A1F7YYS4_9BACT|nr:MAG: methionine--tRNA ligase [Candidatus Woesebacteria bacterium RIFCSPHIGHO2_01_FULL_44_21]OGM69744.1 MAG: methionine--tRNA ligase [Candidatus Woesebacteria bacterium RIFCSPLOWO2_01_FULL_44_24b]